MSLATRKNFSGSGRKKSPLRGYARQQPMSLFTSATSGTQARMLIWARQIALMQMWAAPTSPLNSYTEFGWNPSETNLLPSQLTMVDTLMITLTTTHRNTNGY
jgi:hypothetical protein